MNSITGCDSSVWANLLERSIELKFAEPALERYIDDLLVWFSSIEGTEADDLGEKLLARYGADELRLRFEDCIDRLLISNSSKGMFDTCETKDRAKWRYRKLIRVFHPDKGANSEAWLNFRAEKINGAYRIFDSSLLNKQGAPAGFREKKSKSRMRSFSVNSSS
jgi:hypothetical protein